MNENPKKLVGWKQWAIAVSSLLAGAGLWLLRQYHDTGVIRTSDIVISVVTLCVGLGIVVTIFWYANQPEREEKQ